MTPILDIFVPGTPRPKGSMRHVGKGRMVEQLASSPDWRHAVAQATFDALAVAKDSGGVGLPVGFPHAGPVEVRIGLIFPRPKSSKNGARPSTRTTGDIDKHARNILDALQDGGLIKDDAQVIGLAVTKYYTSAGSTPGAQITTWLVGDD